MCAQTSYDFMFSLLMPQVAKGPGAVQTTVAPLAGPGCGVLSQQEHAHAIRDLAVQHSKGLEAATPRPFVAMPRAKLRASHAVSTHGALLIGLLQAHAGAAQLEVSLVWVSAEWGIYENIEYILTDPGQVVIAAQTE